MSQLVFDNPRNRLLLDKYLRASLENPQWEPLGKVKRGGKRGTVEIDGVEYYKNTSYGVVPYLHNDERPKPFKQVGGKSKIASDIIDVLVDKGAKYGITGASLAAAVLSGNPEFAPIAAMLASDIAPAVSKKVRKTIKDKTGYGIYKNVMDEEVEATVKEPVKKSVKKDVKEPVKKSNKGASEWVKKVKKYQEDNGVSYKEALIALKKK